MSKKRAKNQRSDQCAYPSRYSPRQWVHAAQYITELICEKKAKTENKELPFKFWETDATWLKYYKYQIIIANRLLKKYGESVIIAAMHDKRMWNTYSLRNPFLESVIKEYANKKEVADQIAQKFQYDFSEKKTFKSNKNQKSIISKLRDLE